MFLTNHLLLFGPFARMMMDAHFNGLQMIF